MKLNYFNFKELNGEILLTNDLGKYTFLSKLDFRKLMTGSLDLKSESGRKLLDASMVYSSTDLYFSEENKYKLLNAKSHLAIATSLHIFVVTTACNLNCVYCQANNGTTIPNCFMDFNTAEKATAIALQSPERNLSFEFQGGEPLLNFPIIRHIVEYAESHLGGHYIEYSVVTNLTLITEEMMDFFEQYHFSISTSLDGEASIHDKNRPYKDGSGSYQKVMEGIQIVRNRNVRVGAIETTTRYSLSSTQKLVQTYCDLGFDTIFIRNLTQLGKANVNWEKIGYSASEYLDFYTNVIDELIEINKSGRFIKEQHASIFLKKIKGKRMNYMELRSPCGGGVGQIAYFADGRIFTCDEGRMLAEMGDNAFQLGDVQTSSYQDLIANKKCRTVCLASILETIPFCCDCVYQPYCGTCPVINYEVYHDVIAKEPESFRCSIYKGILDYLFGLLNKGEKSVLEVLDSWCL